MSNLRSSCKRNILAVATQIKKEDFADTPEDLFCAPLQSHLFSPQPCLLCHFLAFLYSFIS